MNRPVVDRAAVDATVTRRRPSLTPSAATEWVVAKVVVIPAAVTSIVNRILHRHSRAEPAVPPSLRRHAGVYVWRPTFGPDGVPDSDGEIVSLAEYDKRPKPPVS